jgi:predicted ATP-grasp superfamily ATP-dependent carboligase
VAERRRAVVTDGDERAALAAVRSLGSAGWHVVVASQRRRSLAAASRHATGEVVVPPPLGDPEGFRGAVAALVQRERPALLLPVSEAALLALGADRTPFAPATVPFPSLEVIRRAADKVEVARLAGALGIGVPDTLILDAPRALSPAELASLVFPVVLKPGRSVRPDDAPGGKFTVSYAADADQLAARLAALPPAAFPLLLQRRVVGPGAGVFLLVDGGEILAAFAHRRVRERPPSGGVSVCRESVALDPELRAAALRLLRALEWRGVAMVEFKIDEATGTPYVMEVNPRLWGSLQLAIDAGVDFPVLLAEWALGRRLPAPPDYRVGVRSRWLWGEADHVLARVRAAFREGAGRGFGEARACLGEQLRRDGTASRTEVLRLADPRPFLRESVRWIRDVLP